MVKLDYYFAGAWHEEPDGIKNKEEFQKLFRITLLKNYDNPVSIDLK